jgi:hypothetical protein
MKVSSFVMFLIIVTGISLVISQNHAYSAQESLTISTDKTSYHYGDNVKISGKVDSVIPHQMVSIEILHPSYPHPELISIVPNTNGSYSYTLPLAIKAVPSGNFSIIANFAGAKSQTTFSYVGPGCNTQTFLSVPIIRGAASNPRIVDSFGNAITGPVKVGQQIQITADLANGQDCVVPFAYIVQIQDSNGVTQSLSWITGTLEINQSFNPGQSWIPTVPDTYTAQIFIWDSLDNPNALAPPMTATISVQ